MMRGAIVVDASVVVEYLVELTLTQAARRLFETIRDPEDAVELWAPDLLYAEVVSALRKLVRLKAIPAPAGTRCVDRLVRLPITATGTAGLMLESWKLRDKMTPYDACYVTLARRLGARFVTADRRLARAAGARIAVPLDDL